MATKSIKPLWSFESLLKVFERPVAFERPEAFERPVVFKRPLRMFEKLLSVWKVTRRSRDY